jgi:hypothetical protein
MPNSIIINGIEPSMTAAVDAYKSLTMVEGITILNYLPFGIKPISFFTM